MTINNVETTNPVTVEDAAGLDALPVGTLILPLDGSVTNLEKIDHDTYEWQFKTLHAQCSREELVTVDGFLPAQVVNPEILGEFTEATFTLDELLAGLDWDAFVQPQEYTEGQQVRIVCSEGVMPNGEVADHFLTVGSIATVEKVHPDFLALRGESTGIFGEGLTGLLQFVPLSCVSPVEVFKVGDIVEIVDGPKLGLPAFQGLQCAVVAPTADIPEDDFSRSYLSDPVLLRPLTERPDGFGTEEFIWTQSGLRLVASAPEAEAEADATAAAETFGVGDIVSINRPTGHASEFHGLQCSVVEEGDDEWGMTHLRPLTERPDGYGFSEFYWMTDELVLEVPASEVMAAEDMNNEPDATDDLGVGAVVMDEVGLEALPRYSIVADAELTHHTWTKTVAGWQKFNVYNGLPNGDDTSYLARRLEGGHSLIVAHVATTEPESLSFWS